MSLREELSDLTRGILYSPPYPQEFNEGVNKHVDLLISVFEKTINMKILDLKKRCCCVKENPTAHDIALSELSDLKLEVLK